MVVVVLAMLIKNSSVSQLYIDFLHIKGLAQVGALKLEKPLFLWVNDAWMAVFFSLSGWSSSAKCYTATSLINRN